MHAFQITKPDGFLSCSDREHPRRSGTSVRIRGGHSECGFGKFDRKLRTLSGSPFHRAPNCVSRSCRRRYLLGLLASHCHAACGEAGAPRAAVHVGPVSEYPGNENSGICLESPGHLHKKLSSCLPYLLSERSRLKINQ